ncbi:MAG: helix-turn-helix transcriptional regulator [Rhodopirellula sp.]|nr:helix-turn-helix transcriptional regulator [Rhodopirellula sp.]
MAATDPDNARLNEMLQMLTSGGLTQQQIASRAGLPAQYLSDLKNGRRTLTELTARRIGAEFGVNYEWLLGTSNLKEPSSLSSEGAQTSEGTIWLPCFPWPISGSPRSHPDWDGTSVELAGVAAARASMATEPYVLRFGRNDVEGRLRKDDLLLITQALDVTTEISVVNSGRKLHLARLKAGQWEKVAGGMLSRTDTVLGYCLGIVWASF